MRQKLTLLTKTMLLLCALMAGSGSAWAEDADVTYDFTDNSWSVSNGSLSNGTISFTGTGDANFKMNTGYFMMGKSGAYINFPTYSSPVEKIVVTGNSNASASTVMNIYVGENAASTATTGSTGTNAYEIASSYQAAGTQYTLKVTSNHNAQITKIEIFYATQSSTWTVTYNGNGADSGSVPTDGNTYNATNNTVSVLGNTGNLAKTGYTFGGWNTKADGTGTTYAANETFTISASTTLYAKWEANTYNVILPAEDEYGTYTMDATNPVAYDTKVKLAFTPKTGYENYAATWSVNGSAISGNSFTMPDEAVTVTVSLEEVFIWDLTTDSYNADPTEETIQWSSTYATMKNERNGSSNTKVTNYIPNSQSSTRMYSGNKLTLTPASGYTIKKVEFTAMSTSYATAFGNSTWTNATASVESGVVTVTPTNGAIAFSATIGGTCGFSSVKVMYEADTTPVVGLSTTAIDAACTETEGTIDVTYVNIADNSSATVFFCDAQGTAASYGWISAEINNDKDIYYLIDANSGDERTAYMKVKVGEIYSDLVTITQAKYVQATSYTLTTTVVPGRHYIIVGSNNNVYKAMGAQGDKNRAAVGITVNNGSTTIASDAGVSEVLLGVDDNGYFTFYDEENDGYLYASCGTGTGNTMNVQSTLDDYGRWTISTDNNGALIIKAQSGSKNQLQYNSGNSIFSCYSATQKNVYLYERDGDTGSQDFTATINAACTDGQGKYYATFSAPFAFTVPHLALPCLR